MEILSQNKIIGDEYGSYNVKFPSLNVIIICTTKAEVDEANKILLGFRNYF